MAHKELRRVLTGANIEQGTVNGNVSCGHFLLLLLVPSLSSLFHSCAAEVETLPSPVNNLDFVGLMAFKTAADPTGTKLTWNTSSPPCVKPGWQGITCDNNTRVSSIMLNGLGLNGTITDLSQLDQLANLTLANNEFTGSMELLGTGLPKLIMLASMSLSGNKLSGSIPDLSGVTALTTLDLSNNNFTNSIPDLPSNLTTLLMSNNQLSGQILALPSTLTTVDVSNNQLSGAIPSNIRNISASGNPGICGTSSSPCLSPRGRSTLSSPAPETNAKKHHKSWKKIIVLVLVDIVGILLIAAGFLVWLLKRYPNLGKKTVIPKEDIPLPVPDEKPGPVAVPAKEMAMNVLPENSKLVFVADAPQKFELEELLRASAEIMGKGSLGTTYRARLDSGNIVAVKRLKDVREMDKKQFDRQMDVLGRLKHPHLLPLRAYYYAKEEKLLVYDYMYNGSLASILHKRRDVEGQRVLDWNTRLIIAYDVAVGLRFLHDKCPLQLFPHQNLKSSNILLGDSYEAYLADFCLAPLMPPKMAAQVMTGYEAPEYSRSKRKSHKADIYSLGVLLLELLTGRQPQHSSDVDDDGIDLPKFVKSAVKQQWTVEVFDTQLTTDRDGDAEMVTVLQLALRCVEENPEMRPPLSKVLAVLESMMSVRQGRESTSNADTSFQSQSQFSGPIDRSLTQFSGPIDRSHSEPSQDLLHSESDFSR